MNLLKIILKSPMYFAIQITVLCLLLIPIFAISFVNYPWAEDFYQAYLIKEFGFIEATTYIINHFSSRFSWLIVQLLNPLVYNFWIGVYIWPIIHIFLLIFTIFKLLRSISSLSNKWLWLISLWCTVIFLNEIPGIFEGIFWWSSAVMYLWGGLTTIIYLIALLKYLNNTLKYQFWLWVIPIIVLGFNEIFSVLLFEILLIAFGLQYSENTKKQRRFLLILISWLSILLILPFFVEGNLNRLNIAYQDQPQKVFNILMAIKLSLRLLFYFILSVAQSLPILFTACLLLLSVKKLKLNMKILQLRFFPFFSTVITFLTVFGILFIFHIIQGSAPPLRIINILIIILIIWLLSNVAYYGLKIKHKIQNSILKLRILSLLFPLFIIFDFHSV